MGDDISSSLAEELSSSYVWQSTTSSGCNRRHSNGAHILLLQGQYTRIAPFVLPYAPQPLSGSSLSSKAIQRILCALSVLFLLKTYRLNPPSIDASGSSRSSTALMSRSAKQGLETSTNPFCCGVPLDARHCRPFRARDSSYHGISRTCFRLATSSAGWMRRCSCIRSTSRESSGQISKRRNFGREVQYPFPWPGERSVSSIISLGSQC